MITQTQEPFAESQAANFHSPPTTFMNERATVYTVHLAPDLVQQIGDLVCGMGLQASRFDSAEEFLRAYDGGHGCLVTEFVLPGMSGLELQRSLAESQILLPMMFLASKPATSDIVQAMRHGAVSVLEVPVESEKLWDAIQEAVSTDKAQRRRAAVLREIRRRVSHLTASEYMVLERMLQGLPNKTIASQLHLSIRSIESRRRRVFEKMGADSVAQLVRLVLAVKEEDGLGYTP